MMCVGPVILNGFALYWQNCANGS